MSSLTLLAKWIGCQCSVCSCMFLNKCLPDFLSWTDCGRILLKTEHSYRQRSHKQSSYRQSTPTDSAPTDSAPTDNAPTDSLPTDRAFLPTEHSYRHGAITDIGC
jgi:hypothetical protein